MGVPIALQELLVQFSFLFIQVVVNSMGVRESAAVGVAEKVCVFLMLVASAYMQAISAFVAQNNGAGKFERSRKALFYGIKTALVAGFIMGCIAFFAGNLLSAIFSSEGEVIAYAHDYLKAYAIDCLLTAVLFCFVGYFNGCGKTVFVMVQGVVGAFCVRILAVYLMSQIDGASLFHISKGIPPKMKRAGRYAISRPNISNSFITPPKPAHRLGPSKDSPPWFLQRGSPGSWLSPAKAWRG